MGCSRSTIWLDELHLKLFSDTVNRLTSLCDRISNSILRHHTAFQPLNIINLNQKSILLGRNFIMKKYYYYYYHVAAVVVVIIIIIIIIIGMIHKNENCHIYTTSCCCKPIRLEFIFKIHLKIIWIKSKRFLSFQKSRITYRFIHINFTMPFGSLKFWNLSGFIKNTLIFVLTINQSLMVVEWRGGE